MNAMPFKSLYQVQLSNATFGIEATNGVVVMAAPIGKWMIGKSIGYVKAWVGQKNGKVIFFGDNREKPS